MLTLLWIFGISALIAFGLTCYFKGRNDEREWIAGQCNVVEQERDQALFERDIARMMAHEKIKDNARLRQCLLGKHLADLNRRQLMNHLQTPSRN